MEALLSTHQAVSCSVARKNRMAATGALTSPCRGCDAAAGSSVQCGRPGGRKMIVLRVLDRSQVRRRFESIRRPFHRPSNGASAIRASNQPGSNVDEKVREITSEEAVEGTGHLELNANVKADELKAEGGSATATATELPVAAELLLSALKEEEVSTNDTIAAKQGAVLDVASASAVDGPKAFFEDVNVEAQEVAADTGRSVEDEAVELKIEAEGLEDREEKEGDLVKKLEFHENDDGPNGSASSDGADGVLPSSRGEVEQKVVNSAKDGYEVLKWAAEGIVSAGQNAQGGLGVVKEALNKRVKSFGIAADDTRDVSSQAAGIAQKKFGEIQGSASKFGEELKVNIEEKKAADSLKPESERNPLSKVTQEVQENFDKATSGDGPLAQLNESLSENLSKASQAGRDFTTRVSERAAELSDKSSSSRNGDVSDSSSRNGDVSEVISSDYEDERGNELLKGQIGSKDEKTNLIFNVDEAQAVPSKKQDKSDIGPDE